MLSKIIAYLNKPELNGPDTAGMYRTLWEDEHISMGMLASHLDPDEDGATSNHKFVFQSVRWIAQIAPPSRYAKLLDLGCGPGVYAEQFVKEGYSVTGVDFSKRSIEYAEEQTTRNGSGIEYHYQNYLTIEYEEQFDVITIINKDYPVLSATDRKTLLGKVYKALKPNGKFILDVLTPRMRQKESRSWQYCKSSGFFSAYPHLLLESVYQYDDTDKTELCQYLVITEDDVKCYLCPNHFFTKESLKSEIEPVGFLKSEFYEDVTGKKYSGSGKTICGVFTK